MCVMSRRSISLIEEDEVARDRLAAESSPITVGSRRTGYYALNGLPWDTVGGYITSSIVCLLCHAVSICLYIISL